ncbi:hypothetical protein [Rhizomicrobium electricum]|uniref:Uncharacterized protein n=1 Tax=Rhizomicrobium electricum TaxID=480070 RepID=A0ABN1EX78_9PROT|nr:hypothetical protein [Rhizomicrobium electricum]NIJ49936.1 hypothetical protein [Rhizomicrobium electricum]
MVAIVKSLFPEQRPAPEAKPVRGSLAKLKALHAEAEETARLANLLGRSGAVGAALPFLAIVTIGLSVSVNPASQIVWLILVGAVALAMLIAYRHAMKRPFERDALKDYAKDLSAILLFAGFAWGAGAFLALPSGLSTGATIAFALLPAASIAYLLRDREALFLFLAPTTVLTAAACLLKPFAGGWIAAVTLIAAAAILVGAARLYERLTGIQSKPAMLSLP